jgi:hypothetical protein
VRQRHALVVTSLDRYGYNTDISAPPKADPARARVGVDLRPGQWRVTLPALSTLV